LADFTDLEQIRDHFQGIDGVFHVGALPRIPYSIEHPLPAAEVNVMGTLNVFVAARDAKVPRVVYSASSSAYGSQDELPLRTDMPANPLNPYALHKYVGREDCRAVPSFLWNGNRVTPLFQRVWTADG
jgi:UDP-glucose 4-epimerase